MDDADPATPTWLDLYDYRHRVAGMYQERARALQGGADPAEVWARFRAQKDALYKQHPQSPIAPAARPGFTGLTYFPYEPALCVEAQLIPTGPSAAAIRAEAHAVPLLRAARLEFALAGGPQQLLVYWIDVYGGGLFLPFRDATCGAETYGGGRYLFDTVKGSDFVRLPAGRQPAPPPEWGYGGGRILLDFNYAYNPSCAYDARWACPLAPPENRVALAIRAGEQRFGGD